MKEVMRSDGNCMSSSITMAPFTTETKEEAGIFRGAMTRVGCLGHVPAGVASVSIAKLVDLWKGNYWAFKLMYIWAEGDS